MSKNIIASAAIGLSLFALGVVGSKAQGSNSTLTKELILKTGTYNSLLKTGAQSSNYTYTLPITTPTTNQVLTATAVSGTDVTLGWSSAGGGGGVTYGPASVQNTLTPVTTRLFDVAYTAGSGNAAGAQITSSTTSGTSLGLQVNASGTTTVIGAALSATGGSSNYALVVPASSGNVGIGNNAPGSLLSVGSSGQLTVNTSGNLATSGTVAVTGATLSMGPAVAAPEIRFYEPSGSGSEYSSIKAQAQGATVNYILPTTAPTGADRALVVSSVAGSDVTLKWSTTSMGTSQLNLAKLASAQSTSTNVYADITGFSFTANANTTYKFEILVAFQRTAGSGGKDVDLRFSFPSGTTTYTQIKVAGASSVFTTLLEQGSPTVNTLSNIDGTAITYLYTGYVSIGGTGGTFQASFRNVTNTGTVDILTGSYITVSN